MKRILATIGIILAILFLPTASKSNPYLEALQGVSYSLLGTTRPGDVAADFYGFQALLRHKNPYRILGPAYATIGLDWDVKHPNTHPPTAFLVVAPVAWMRWPQARLAWAWLMLTALVCSFRAIGNAWRTSLLLAAMSLLWPPTNPSLSQTTIVWLLGLALAYQLQTSKPAHAGIAIGIASFSKFLPALMLVPLVIRRNWSALAGFVLSWMVGIGIVYALAPNAFSRYLDVGRTTTVETIMRSDNASPVALLYTHRLHVLELVALLLLCVAVAFVVIRFLLRALEAEPMSFAEWAMFVYLSVALLPIMWSYSIMPLLPILIRIIQRGRLAAVAALGAIVLPFLGVQFGDQTRYWLLPTLLLTGSAIAAYAWPDLSFTRPKGSRESGEDMDAQPANPRVL